MKRGWARTLALASLLPLAASVGCDALTVRSFAGTVMQLTISGVTAQSIPANQHLELWARTQYDDIVRVSGYYDFADGKTTTGLMIRQAISLDDPCMIDGYYFANGATQDGGQPAHHGGGVPQPRSGGRRDANADRAGAAGHRSHQSADRLPPPARSSPCCPTIRTSRRRCRRRRRPRSAGPRATPTTMPATSPTSPTPIRSPRRCTASSTASSASRR